MTAVAQDEHRDEKQDEHHEAKQEEHHDEARHDEHARRIDDAPSLDNQVVFHGRSARTRHTDQRRGARGGRDKLASVHHVQIPPNCT